MFSLIIDSHIHISLNSLFTKKEWKNFTEDFKVSCLGKILRKYKSKGVLALRDGGDGIGASCLARRVAEQEGIIYKTPVFAVSKKDHYGKFLGKPVDGLEDFKNEFSVLKENKLDHLKIMLTGIVNFNKFGDVGDVAFTYEELEYMVKSAEDYGVPVMVHANGCKGVSIAIRAGVHTIEHGFLTSDKELYGMAEKGIIWVPTLSPLGNILDTEDENFKDQLPIIKKVYDIHAENIKKAYEMGVKIALGSDAGAYAVGHGTGIFDEIRHFENIGFDENTVMEMCSKNGREALKI